MNITSITLMMEMIWYTTKDSKADKSNSRNVSDRRSKRDEGYNESKEMESDKDENNNENKTDKERKRGEGNWSQRNKNNIENTQS